MAVVLTAYLSPLAVPLRPFGVHAYVVDTPADFDEEHFYYKDPKRQNPREEHLESDMEKMRKVITGIVDKTDLKVLICPEMTYQVPMGRRYLYEPLPEKIKERVVLKREYWITDEAQTVYAAAHSLVSMEICNLIIKPSAMRHGIRNNYNDNTSTSI